jgi:hypothetical protein
VSSIAQHAIPSISSQTTQVPSSPSKTDADPFLQTGLGTALTCGPPNTWKVLVVDDYSKRLLESVYKVFDVLHMNITGELLECWKDVEPESRSMNVGREKGMHPV